MPDIKHQSFAFLREKLIEAVIADNHDTPSGRLIVIAQDIGEDYKMIVQEARRQELAKEAKP